MGKETWKPSRPGGRRGFSSFAHERASLSCLGESKKAIAWGGSDALKTNGETMWIEEMFAKNYAKRVEHAKRQEKESGGVLFTMAGYCKKNLEESKTILILTPRKKKRGLALRFFVFNRAEDFPNSNVRHKQVEGI